MPQNRMRRPFSPVLLLALVVAQASYAHSLHLFAAPEGDAVKGRVYFPSGPAKKMTVKVFGPDDALLGETVSGEDGSFVWTPNQRCDLRFVAETVDGHRTEFIVHASELPGNLPATGPVAEPAPESVAPPMPPAENAAPTEVSLQQLIEAEVSREVQPMRAQLDQLEHTTRLRDVLGGIGYIVGVAGLFAWFKSRTGRSRA